MNILKHKIIPASRIKDKKHYLYSRVIKKSEKEALLKLFYKNNDKFFKYPFTEIKKQKEILVNMGYHVSFSIHAGIIEMLDKNYWKLKKEIKNI